jgi:hypothetical protein
MRARWGSLKSPDLVAYRATMAFLNGRLEQRETVEWALRLKTSDAVKRAAILDLIDSSSLAQKTISEPWLSAWRLIQESWENSQIDDRSSSQVYDIRQRLKHGERSQILIGAIIQLVSARITVGFIPEWHSEIRKLPKRPRKVDQLISVGLTSGEIVNPQELGLSQIKDLDFLMPLAHALDAAVVAGLDAAHRIGWDEKRSPWRIGLLNRVYFVPPNQRASGEHEPDEFHRGIAPSVKLLHSVIAQLAELDAQAALDFVLRWRRLQSPVHTRLWAALSRDPSLTQADDVASFLLSLDDRLFWNQNSFPEIAELRAVRFREFAPTDQSAILTRLRRGPPRAQWPKKLDKARVEKARLYWAIREFRRIEMTGTALPDSDQAWIASQIAQFPDLINMTRVDDGFMGMPKAQWVAPNPDARYDSLSGDERLKSLEAALSSARGEWDDNLAGRATDWIQQRGNQLKLITDLEEGPGDGADFPRVWERLGWAHSPGPAAGETSDPPRDLIGESNRVLSLLEQLPPKTIRQAVDGISQWLSAWKKQIVGTQKGLIVWLKVWPIAVEETNAKQPTEDELDLNTTVQPSGYQEPMDLDTLNTSVGKLVGVFLAACPSVKPGDQPFEDNAIQTQMRNAIEDSIGPSGLIVKYRLVESLFYFLNADLEWTKKHLIPPVLADSNDALILWRAVGRRTRFSQELALIGGAMLERATDRRLGRETRQSLVFSLVVEGLHSFQEKRSPMVPLAKIQQMIRSIDDEVRAFGAGAIQRFVQESSARVEGHPIPPSREELFRSAAKPFLQQVWPQERSLSTPGVSKALADLPVTAGGEFVETVNTIERFLVPFDCWAMHDYGFYGEEDRDAKLSKIDNEEKAAALLVLLDRTIGDTETSVVPIDLGDALDQVRKVAPTQVETQIFRRLATAARRTQ